MNILLLSSTDDWKNGYGNITHEYAGCLRNKVNFTLLLPRNEQRRNSPEYDPRYVLPKYIFNLKTPHALDYLWFDFNASGFDIIHCLFEFPYALIAARLAKKYHKPLIIGTQGTYAIQPLHWYPERWFMNAAYNAASLITAPSAFTRNCIIESSHIHTPIRILHNAVNFERFQRSVDIDKIRSQWPGKKILLTVGGLKERKGQDIVIRALSQLERHDVHYVIIGSGNLRDTYQRLSQELGVANQVSLLGQIDGDELVAYFHACDVYIHTPVFADWHFEGFGIVYLEASACSKPIIASLSGGVPDAVVDGVTGLLVPESDIQGTAKAIKRMLDDPELRHRMGVAGREYARKHSWSDYVDAMIKIYEELTRAT